MNLHLPHRTTATQSDRRPGHLTAVRAYQNLLVSDDGTTAWFVLDEVEWAYRSPEERETILSDQAARWADLAPRKITLRSTSAPLNRAAWIKQLRRDFPTREEAKAGPTPRSLRLPDREGASSFWDVTAGAEEQMIALGARSTAVFLGVHLTDLKLSDSDLRRVNLPIPLTDQHAALDEVRRDLTTITGIVASDGLHGTPVNRKSLGWLIHSSMALGLPVPPVYLKGKAGEWEDDDIPGFGAGVIMDAPVYGASTTIHAVRSGVEETSHVVVLHVEKFAPRPENSGLGAWFSWFQTLPYGVDVLAQFHLMVPDDLRKEAEGNRRRLDDQIAHYAEHKMTAPGKVVRAAELASIVEDDTLTGGRNQTRARGVILVAVTSDTEDDALNLASSLTSTAMAEQGITLVTDHGQYQSARSFIPGEMVSHTGFPTQMRVDFLAAGVPNASSKCGDGQGWFVGPVGGGHDVMLFDPHGGSGREMSNLMVIGAAPGVAGKSSLGAALLDWGARCGELSIGFDPAGQWQRLCDLPHLRSDARHLDLFSARRGILNPSVMVPEPNRMDYAELNAEEFSDRVADSRQERLELTIDTMLGLLPFGMTNNDTTGRIAGYLDKAITEAGGHYGADPWQIIANLEGLPEPGPDIAAMLRTRAELKDGGLIFQPEHTNVNASHSELTSSVLTIITLKGLALPPKDNPHRATWTRKQQASIPVLNLSSYLATSAMYAGKARTNILMDEMGMVTGGAGGSFGPFLTRASVDSRKWNTLVGLLFQNPGMLTAIDPEIANLVGTAWIGKMSRDVARQALPLLGLEPDSGAERVIASLGKGEWLIRDWTGRIRMVRVHRDGWDPDTFAAIDTTPEGAGTYNHGGLPGIYSDDDDEEVVS